MIRFLLRPVPTNLILLPLWGACCLILGTSDLQAGPETGGGVVSIAEREIQRRGNVIQAQLARLDAADKLLKSGSTAQALTIYEDAYNTIPDLPLAQEIKSYARQSYLNAGLIRAQELMNQADYSATTKILDTLDRSSVAKGHPSIQALRSRMADPDRYPPALTPTHIKNVEEVQRLLTLAASQHETGMYDRSLETYESVLRIDSTNSAARRGMEAVERDRGRYFDAARDHQRSRMLNQVNGLWEDQPKLKTADLTSMFGGSSVTQDVASSAKKGRDSIVAKLKDIKLERIDFTGAALEEVIEYLRVRSRDLDPTGKGVDFVLSLPADQTPPPVTLNLVNVPIEEVLRYITEISGVNYRVEEFAVRIISLSDTNQTLISKSYRVPPDFITTAAISSAPAAAADPFAAGNPAVPASGLVRRMGAKEFLESRGITFPEGGGASYSTAANTLTVRTNANNIYLVDSLVEQSLNSSPKMAVIEVKIVEITNSKLDEMGFDWLLQGFGSEVRLAGGTVGNAQKNTFGLDEFTMNNAVSQAAMGPVTAGLRSSGDLNSNRSIDEILYGVTNSQSKRSPGILSLTGVLTDPQFQVVWRALDQKTGIDVVSKPSVITRSGNKASVEVVRELIYPTEFDPPQIPTNIGNANTTFYDADTGELIPQEIPPIPVTPTTPTAFETRRVGTILDVEPVISEDGRSVDLTITPELVEFNGFVNYGSPINTVGTTTDPTSGAFSSEKMELTPNTILQPIFSTKKVVTSVKIYDGATVVLGGLITDQTTMINDKVPLLGDIPVVGRLFQSKVKQRRSKNLILFVTVKVVDPSGNRVNPQ